MIIENSNSANVASVSNNQSLIHSITNGSIKNRVEGINFQTQNDDENDYHVFRHKSQHMKPINLNSENNLLVPKETKSFVNKHKTKEFDKLLNGILKTFFAINDSGTAKKHKYSSTVDSKYNGKQLTDTSKNYNFPVKGAQKVLYLKANRSREASNIISHVNDVENNITAWPSLKEPYNNKKVLMAPLMGKILNQPTETSFITAIICLHDTTGECLLALQNLLKLQTMYNFILVGTAAPKEKKIAIDTQKELIELFHKCAFNLKR
uniref:Uncharacterized protein n=1 Tax=Glossina austeni TaxID=7395 RepID=A0A1A9VP71_GLOAU